MTVTRVEGIETVTKNLDKAGVGLKQATTAALYQMGFKVMADAVLRTPVLTGRLRTSHFVSPPTGIERPLVQIGFGVKYALPVHERTEVNHPRGEAKFLTNAVNHARGGFIRDMAALTRANFRAGIGVDAIPAVAPTKPTDTGE